jgi:hypothetical protein
MSQQKITSCVKFGDDIYIYIIYPEVVVVSFVLVLERQHDRCKAGEKAARDA